MLVSFWVLWIAAASAAADAGACELVELVPPGAPGDLRHFGDEVDLDGDLAILGGIAADAAVVYRRVNGEWVEEAVLVGEDTVPGEFFGKALAIEGDVAVVGAPSDDSFALSAGAAYVFRYDPELAAWAQEVELIASDAMTGDRFGWSVALEGPVLAVGANFEDNENGTAAGAMYMFRFDGSRWVEESKLIASDGGPSGFLGRSVAVSGDVAVAGAFSEDEGGDSVGAAYVFRCTDGVWVEEAKFVGEGEFTNLGRSVSVHGDLVLAGSPTTAPGAAYLFRFDGRAWEPEALLQPPPAPGFLAFGGAVAIHGETAIIGATGYENLLGETFVFRRQGERWPLVETLLASDGVQFDTFGSSVALDGDIALIGAEDTADGHGSAYVFAGLSGADCNGNGVADGCEVNQSADGSPDGPGDGCPCAWDVDGDAVVGVAELIALILAWGTDPVGPPDFDGDGSVGLADLETLIDGWGGCR